MDLASAERVYQRADGRAARIFVDKNIISKAHCCGYPNHYFAEIT